ncbi:MAG: hypothetical protein IJ837_01105 [Clostridia bacterium]|nr:hypothetical protein [Clostridia bacterium]
MKAKEWICYSLLAVIAVVIVIVIILSFVPKKLAPTISAVSSKSIVDELPTAQISVSKYEDGKEYAYKMITSKLETDETMKSDYESVIKTFNNLSSYSIMQGLFLGLSNADQKITYKESGPSITSLHQQTDGYLIEFEWTEKQKLKNVDGTEYKTSDNQSVTFTKLAIFVDDKNEVADYKIYVKTYTSDDSSCRYYYTAYSNVLSLYNLATSFDNANKLQAPLK